MLRASPVRRLLLHGAAVAVCALAAAGFGEGPRPFEYRQVHMGLPVRILLHTPDAHRAEAAARAAFERIAALEQVMSDYRPDSEVRRLEGTGGRWTPASPALLEVLETAISIARATGGAFDPTIGPLVSLWRDARASGRLPPAAALDAARARVGWRYLEIDRRRGMVRLAKSGMRLDLGGVAKGYILQEALRALQANGVTSALIDSGGDVVAGDAPPGRGGWHVDAAAAQTPFLQRASALRHAALATSGSTEQFVEIDGVRYSHIVDPRTGVGVTHQTLARVIAADAAVADALATALVIVGPAGARAIREAFPDAVVSLTASGPR